MTIPSTASDGQHHPLNESGVVPVRAGSDHPIGLSSRRHQRLLTLMIWLLPLQTMLLLPGFPYISPPAVLAAILGLMLLAVGDRPTIWAAMSRHTPLGGPILVFVAYTVSHGVLVDLYRQAILEPSVLGGEFLRQLLSLLSGYAVYVYARWVLMTVDAEWVLARLRWSIAPHLLLGLLGTMALALGMMSFDNLLAAIRTVIIPVALAQENLRATGLATEPSYFGIILVAIYLPAFIARWKHGRPTPVQISLAGVVLVNILGTASLTSYLCLAAVAIYLLCRKAKYLWIALPVVGIGVLAVASVLGQSDSYALLQLSAAVNNVSGASDNASLSFLDTWYSYAGPLQLYDWHLFAGLGLGGTETHVASVFPEAVADALRNEFDKDRVGVLVGRVIVEQGFIGTLLFAWVWVRAWKLIDQPSAPARGTLLLKWVLIGCLAGYFFKLGSFSLPYMWLLFAFLEARQAWLQRGGLR